MKHKLLIVLGMLIGSQVSAGNCPNRVNIAVQLDQSADQSIPKLAKHSQRRVCVKSGGQVDFHRVGRGTPNGFTIFLKDGSWSADSNNGRITYDAPIVEEEYEQAYGISMPDADEDLDPIIVITPGINN
jgi:hypothetical protein